MPVSGYLWCSSRTVEISGKLGTDGAFHLRTSVYLLCTLIPSFAQDSAYHLGTFSTPQ